MAPSIAAPPWTGAPCLKLVHEFNQRFIEKVADAARESGPRTMPQMVRAHWDLWMGLDGATSRRASLCPFLLADIEFRNAAWWRRARHDAAWRSSPNGPVRLFRRGAAVELTRDALFVAWRTAQQDIRLASTLLAMSEEVARIVSALGLDPLRRIPDHHHQRLRPRWEHVGTFWGRLLSAARRDDRVALRDLHLHAFQLADAESRFAASATIAPAVVRD